MHPMQHGSNWELKELSRPLTARKVLCLKGKGEGGKVKERGKGEEKLSSNA